MLVLILSIEDQNLSISSGDRQAQGTRLGQVLPLERDNDSARGSGRDYARPDSALYTRSDVETGRSDRGRLSARKNEGHPCAQNVESSQKEPALAIMLQSRYLKVFGPWHCGKSYVGPHLTKLSETQIRFSGRSREVYGMDLVSQRARAESQMEMNDEIFRLLTECGISTIQSGPAIQRTILQILMTVYGALPLDRRWTSWR